MRLPKATAYHWPGPVCTMSAWPTHCNGLPWPNWRWLNTGFTCCGMYGPMRFRLVNNVTAWLKSVPPSATVST